MKSSLKNMVLTLLTITAVSATVLGMVYSVTLEPIAAAKAAKATGALSTVLPPFDNNPSQDTVTVDIDGLPILVQRATKGDDVVGYAVESISRNGFSGEIRILTGFLPEGDIYNIEVLQHNETPGLGSKMTEPDNVLLASFRGRNPADLQMRVRKDGGDIDAITASTITSRAYVEAVDRAFRAFQEVALGVSAEEKPVDFVAKVLPQFDNDPYAKPAMIEVDGQMIAVYTATLKGKVVGYAVRSITDKGFKGEIELMVGFLPSGEINNIEVVNHNETPGFGSHMTEPGNPLLLSFKGKNPANLKMSLKKKGGDIDAITASTISSEAYVDAVRKAYEAFRKVKGGSK